MILYSGVVLFIGMVSAAVPEVLMNDGRWMPAIALGTYLGVGQDGLEKPVENEVRNAVLEAIDIGYRHIDTAYIYQTEQQIGEALETKMREGTVSREDLFITTKLWNTHHKREQVAQELRESLNQLRLEYVDLYLMHWPFALNEDYTFSAVDYLETWRGMQDVQKLGLARSIGVSNFNQEQLLRLLQDGGVTPAALQIEVHPSFTQSALLELCRSRNITVMGYSPLGSLVPRYGASFPGPKLGDPVLGAIGAKHNKTVAQVVLRWAVEKNVVPLPKTVKAKRLRENIDIFDFALTDEEIQQIDEFNTDSRLILPSFWQEHKYYPFEKVENPLPDPFLKKYHS